MRNRIPNITPCLWFAGQAEEAAEFYTSIFPDSAVIDVTRYGKAGYEVHGQQAGAVMTVSFRLGTNTFTALNGGPAFKFNEAVSFQIPCETQEEVDYYWEKLSADGDSSAQQCGWLKDKFGLSWQVFPAALTAMLADPDFEKSERVMNAMLQMKKINLAELQRACQGE
jgi:predicted 3-demethylubiquinone-9 3-methyltransferase (glyoxalase superfamily)